MKKTIIIFLMGILLLVASVSFSFSAPLKTVDTVQGTMIKTFWIATTGDWQAITMPATIEDARHISIQVHNGTATDYTHIDNQVEFQISSESAGTGWTYASGIVVSVGKQAGEIVCYVKAALSQQIAILVLR